MAATKWVRQLKSELWWPMVLSFHVSCEHVFNSKSMLGQGDLSYFCELLLMHGKLMPVQTRYTQKEFLGWPPSRCLKFFPGSGTLTSSRKRQVSRWCLRSFSWWIEVAEIIDNAWHQFAKIMEGAISTKPFEVPNSDLLKHWCTMIKCTGQTICCSVPCTRTFQQIWARQPRLW